MRLKLSNIQKNITANFFKISVIFCNQVLLVPAYIHYLGIELYSDWIVISAIASFFTMSDVGISSVSNNMFSISYNRGKISECKKILYNNLLFTSTVLTVGLIGILVLGSCVDFKNLLNLHEITNNESVILCALLVLQILLVMSGNVFDSVYNAVHLAHKATYINNVAKLCNALLIFFGLALRLNLCVIIAISIIPNIVINLYKIVQTRKIFKYNVSFHLFDFKYLKSIIKPSVGFMFFPAGNAILFQGLTLIVNSFLGPWALVLFNTTRTMTNFIRNLVQAVSSGIKPEFSIAYAQRNISLMKQLYHKSIKYSVIIASIAICGLLVGGDIIYTIWTKNQIKYDALLVLIFCMTLFINSIWEGSCITMTSTNRHFKFSLVYVISTVATIAVAYFTVDCFSTIYAAAASLILVDIVMMSISLPLSKKIINTPY